MSLYLEELLERVAEARRRRDHAMVGARVRRYEGDRKRAAILVTVARAYSRRALQVQRYADELADVEAFLSPPADELPREVLAARQKGRLQ